MADAATMTIKAVLFPDEIQTTLKDLIEVGPGESWFAKLTNTTIGNLHANNGGPNADDAGDASIQCVVAAIIADV
jgi:hypothetical protein